MNLFSATILDLPGEKRIKTAACPGVQEVVGRPRRSRLC
jgi:hypothetical protein